MVTQADKDYEPQDLEARVQERWERTDAYRRTRKHRAGGDPWYFIDGPPYASGHIHLGTAWNKILKDLKVRFQTMRGFHVRDQPGYDMHGLPIEVKVEQELGIEDKGDIEELGIGSFVEECRSFAQRFKDTMTEEFRELGVWFDWDDPYMTITDTYMEGAWWTVKRAHERDLLYQAERGINWCPRCETALAEAELEYWNEEDPSIFVKLPVTGNDDEDDAPTYLVIWTTTPWTLPANNAVAVHPDLRYVKLWVQDAQGNEEHLIVAEDRAEDVAGLAHAEHHTVVEHMTGEDLEGIPYEHPFLDEVPYHRDPASDASYTVLLGEHVTAEYTGLVHTATGHGAEDFDLGVEHGIPPFSPVGTDGRYTDEAGAYAGLHVKEANDRILQDLQGKDLLLHHGTLTHRYGHCWRCKTPILFRTTNQWFIRITDVKDTMVSEVDRVTWTPEWAGSARQRDWVEGARDWCISRQRYWGIPVPIWRDEAGHTQVVGSRSELDELRTTNDPLPDLHRPWIDDVELTCPDCGDTMHRVEDVLDVWFDSAVASWAQLGYPGTEESFDRWFPCDWIVEGLDQTRGWFYSQLAAGVTSMDRVPYESVLMHGFIHDEDGRPMSKSLGNIVQPSEVIQRHGVDPFRFYLLQHAPWDDVSFGWEGVESAERSLNILWNVHVFATTYMSLDGFDPQAVTLEDVENALRPEDAWILSRLATVTTDVTTYLETDHLHRATRSLEEFMLEDVSRWYVRLIRDRTWVEADDPTKQAAYLTLHNVLHATARLLAPFTPHLAEAIYRDLGGEHPTVHMEDWPDPAAWTQDTDLEDRMAVARRIVEAASNARQQGGMKLRWPVREIVVSGGANVEDAVAHLPEVMKDQANAKAVRFAGDEWTDLQLQADPVRSKVGPTFKGDAPAVMDAIRDADGETLRSTLEEDGAWEVETAAGTFEVTPEMVTFHTTLPDHVLGEDFDGGSVYVDTEVTPEIESEGYARELVRRIQEMRKEMDLDVDARIRTELALPEEIAGKVEGWLTEVAAETRSDALEVVDDPQGDHVKAWDVEGHEVVVGVQTVR